MRDGGVILYGSYGRTEGKTVGPASALAYGFYVIDVCQKSPVLIQLQSSIPFRVGSVDGIIIINPVLYNRVLGYGKAQGVAFIVPDPHQPDKYSLNVRNVFTFQKA